MTFLDCLVSTFTHARWRFVKQLRNNSVKSVSKKITQPEYKILCGPFSIKTLHTLLVSWFNSYFTAAGTWSDFTPCPRCAPPTSYMAWWPCRRPGSLGNGRATGGSPPGVRRSSGSGCSSAYTRYSRFLRDPVAGRMSCLPLPAAVK